MKTTIKQLAIALAALVGSILSAKAEVQKTETFYPSMWNRVAEAFNNDLPKSALVVVREIRDHALTEDNQPQLLRALATEFTISHEVSPDSDAVTLHRVEEILEREQRPVEKALWQYVLGKLRNDPVLLFAAIKDAELLADTPASRYVPAFVLGCDSRVFNDDLLSVLTFDAIANARYRYVFRDDCIAAFNRMIGVYESQGNKAAVLIANFRDMEGEGLAFHEQSKMHAAIHELLPEIKRIDKRSKGKAAKVLQEWIEKEEAPSVSLYWESKDNIFYPGETVKMSVSSKNTRACELRIHRLDGVTSDTFDEFESPERLLKRRGRTTLVSSTKKTLNCENTYEFFRDTLEVQLPGNGIYVVELNVDGSTKEAEWLKVSSCLPVFFSAKSDAGNVARMTIVDAHSGKPLTQGVSAKWRRVNRYSRTPSGKGKWEPLEPGTGGNFDVSKLKDNDEIALFVGEDRLFPIFEMYGNYYSGYSCPDVVETYARIYTDRAIYRPGQKVQVSGLVYSRNNDDYNAAKDIQGQLVLQDKDRKDISEIAVITDDFGQFSAEFDLPAQVVPGRFCVVFRSSPVRTTTYISVEEYKRPTFRVSLEVPNVREVLGKTNWEEGDTICIQGLVETFSGVPVPEAEVNWTTEFRRWTWLRHYDDGDDTTTTGKAVSDSEGRFTIELVCGKGGHYNTAVDATAPNGETASSSCMFYVGTWSEPVKDKDEEDVELFATSCSKDGSECALTIDVRGLKKEVDLPLYVFYDLVSAKGGVIESQVFELTDSKQLKLVWKPEYGEGAKGLVCFLKENQLYSHDFGVQKPLPDKKLKLEWSTFRDHLQPGETETWSLTVKNPDGTPADACVMARLYDASLDAFTRSPWEFSLAFDRRLPLLYLSNARLYNSGLSFTTPVEQKAAFNFSGWEPTMFSYYAAMSALSSHMMRKNAAAGGAVLYDAMPVAAPMMERSVSAAMSDEDDDFIAFDAAEMEESAAEEAQAAPVRENFDETAFFMPALRTNAEGEVTLNFTLPESLTSWNFTALAHTRGMDYGMLNDTIYAQKILSAEIAAPRFLREGDRTDIPVTVRNLGDELLAGELIFLISDAKTGKALKTEKRKFTLDAKGASTQNAKTFTFPLAASADVNVRAVARAAAFSDGEERPIPVISGRETIQVSVPFSATKAGTLKVDLKPLALGRLMKQDAQCKPELTLEYCENPIWNVIRVLPTLFEGEAYCATDWATRLYAIEVGDFLANRMKDTESAALVDSLIGKKDIPALRYAALDHLKEFQRGDGGFCWFSCFQSSVWITTDVCILLARQQKMTNSRTANQMLTRASQYLAREMETYAQDLKKSKDPVISELALRYLYVRELLALEPGKTEKYLLDLAAKEKKNLTMYGKSAVAQILQKSHNADALLALQSLVEHTVSTPVMGRYFDTDRAFSGWASYKIPTQTMAIEALTSFEKAGVESIPASSTLGDASPSTVASPSPAASPISALKEEMKLWLLQSKRTQKWESSRASADATYALLHGDCSPAVNSQLFQTLSPENYSKRQLTPEETKRALASDSYNIIKENDGLSWGALYADYTLPIEQVEQSSAGFTVSRVWEVKREGKWVPVSTAPAAASSASAASAANTASVLTPGGASQGEGPATSVKIGEHVRQVITVRAERDYDFVLVDASRAACLEPVHPLSGTEWMGGTICYRMVHDSSNHYYFEHLAKGTHTFTEELVVDRAGTFATGLARVQCTFAPEFGGYAPSARIFAISK